MRAGHLLFSLVNLLFAFLLVALGIFIFTIPYAPDFRQQFVAFFQEGVFDLKVLGGLLALLGLFLLITFYFLHRRGSLVLKMGSSGKVTIDELALQKYVQGYFKDHFPGTTVDFQATCSKGQIYIIAELPQVPFEEQKSFLEQIERDFEKLFRKYLGYNDEFFFTVTFRD